MYSTAHDFKIIQWDLLTRNILGVFWTSGKYNQTLIFINILDTLIVGDDKGNLTKVSINSFKYKQK